MKNKFVVISQKFVYNFLQNFAHILLKNNNKQNQTEKQTKKIIKPNRTELEPKTETGFA
jgi:hypothetical protein